MNLNEFTSRPQANTTYAKNQVPPFVTSAYSSLYAALKINNTVIFEGTYVRNFDGTITIDFKGVYDDYLSTLMPNQSEDFFVSQNNLVKAFQAEICPITNGVPQHNQAVTVTYRVANAKLNGNIAFGQWCKTHFLSNQPSERHTNEEAPEWLTYNPDDESSGGTIWRAYARIYKKVGGHVDLLLESTSVILPFSFNVSFLRIIGETSLRPSALLGYYDIRVTKNNVAMCSQRYFYNYRTGREKYYCITNALGGIDTLICQGDNTLAPELNFNLGRINGLYKALDDTDDLRQWRQNIGMVPTRLRNWVHELLTQRQPAVKYDPENNEYQDIVINMADISISDRPQLAPAEFGYLLQEPVNAVEQKEIKDKGLSQSSADNAENLPEGMGAFELDMYIDGKHVTTDDLQVLASEFYVEFTLPAISSIDTVHTPINYELYDQYEYHVEGSFVPESGRNKITINCQRDCNVVFYSNTDDYSYDGLVMKIWWY